MGIKSSGYNAYLYRFAPVAVELMANTYTDTLNSTKEGDQIYMHELLNGNLRFLYIHQAAIVTMPSYWHCADRHCYAFSFVLSGSLELIQDNGTVIHANKGDFVYYPLHSRFTMRCLTPTVTCYICDFDGYSKDEPGNILSFTPSDPSRYEKAFQDMLGKNNINVKNNSSNIEIISSLCQIYTQVIQDTSPHYSTRSKKQMMEMLCLYIQSNIASPSLTIQSLADLAQTSEKQLRRLFQAVHGCSPSKYISNTRISLVKELMEDPKLTLQDISKKSGFSSFSYFSTAFKNATGMTPSQYRNSIVLRIL